MTNKAEADPTVSRYTHQRLDAAIEENLPHSGPSHKLLLALIAEDRRRQADYSYREAAWHHSRAGQSWSEGDPQTQADNLERCRLELEQAEQNRDQTRQLALDEINQKLPVELSWDELDRLLDFRLKNELKNAEIGLAAAIIDRQQAVAAADEALQSQIAKIQAGQAVAGCLTDPSNA